MKFLATLGAKPSIKNFLTGAVFILCSILLLEDGLHFSIPVAFVICIFALWKRGATLIHGELSRYQQSIQRNLDGGHIALEKARDLLESAKKAEIDLAKTIETILQSAHQDAAWILRKAQNDIDAMKDAERQQCSIQNVALRQKWRAAMGQELVSAMRDYISENPSALPKPEHATHLMSQKISQAIDHYPSVKK
jgi:F0F1-type ATP synthase membrane subunit b/b'